ncbi:hypothetical protein ACFC4S_27125 [Priestia megaterium]|uniref:hypothetical protein n=1 Tax=Priestia megaterium TaxID=1404 RepID=UPI0035D93F7C
MKIDWNEIKMRILTRFALEFPFLKITGLLNFDVSRYICSRHLTLDNNITVENIEFALRKTFKIIGMKVDISKFPLINNAMVEEMKELLYTPTLFFNLDAGLNFSIQSSNLNALKRIEMIKRIQRIQLYGSEGDKKHNLPIDVLFGDEEYIRDKLAELRSSATVQKILKKFIDSINYDCIKLTSEKMKKHLRKYIQEETRSYFIEYDKRDNVGG